MNFIELGRARMRQKDRDMALEDREEAKRQREIQMAGLEAALRAQGIIPEEEAVTETNLTNLEGGMQATSTTAPTVPQASPIRERFNVMGSTPREATAELPAQPTLQQPAMQAPGVSTTSRSQVDPSRYAKLGGSGRVQDRTQTPQAIAAREKAAAVLAERQQQASLSDLIRRGMQGDQAAAAEAVAAVPTLANTIFKPKEEKAPQRLQSVTLDDGVWMVNPTTGERVTRVGNRAPTQTTEPSWQVVQTDAGIVQVNPKTGESRPVQAPSGGTQLRGRTPVAVQNAMMQNAKQLAVLDTALAELEKRPQSVGPTRGRSDMYDQWKDPEGTAVRAAIADIGSMEIVTRSGAAVSVHEFSRLAPFIPSASDRPAVVKIKLQRMRAIIKEEAELNAQRIAGTLGQSAGQSAPANPWR